MVVALPDLGAVAAALLLLLIAAALWVIIRLLTNSLGHAPVIGSWISGTLAGWLNDARNAILDAAKASWHAAVQLFEWIKEYFVWQYDLVFRTIEDASGAVYRLAYVRLPELLASATSYALSVYHSAVAYADSRFNAAIAYAAGLLSTAEAYALTVYHSAVSYAAQLFARAEADAIALVDSTAAALASDITRASTALRAELTQLGGQLVTDIDGLAASTQAAVNTLAGDLAAGVATAEAVAASALTGAVGGIYTDLEQLGRQAVSDAWPDAAGDIQALRGTLGADFPWLNDLLGALGGLGTAGLAGALIQSLAGAHAVTRLANDCIVPNCRNLGGLGNDLSNLLGAAETAALLAWLAELARNPSGWASDMAANAAPVGNDAIGTVRTLLGV